MKIVKVAPFLTLSAAFLMGCGDESTTVNETTGLTQLAAGESLPECTDDNAGEMLFAADSGLVYYCANGKWQTLNGKDGADGKDGTDGSDGTSGESCEAVALEDGSGYKILCGEDSVGVVKSGADGEKGESGEDCTVLDDGNGTVKVACASDTTILYRAICGSTPFEPTKQFCSDGQLYSCGNLPFDPTESFCYNDGTKDSIVALCGGSVYDIFEFTCTNDALYFTDSRDNQVYRATTIGSQIWMAQNLNYRYTQGTADLDSSSFCYENEPDSCAKYGRLYLWSAAMDSAAVFSEGSAGCGYDKTCSVTESVRGVCPAGWHLPTLAEFETLVDYAGGKSTAGTKLKATSGWPSSSRNNYNGTDDYGFSALSAGYRYYLDGVFYSEGYSAYFWSATENENDVGESCYIWLYGSYVTAELLSNYYKSNGLSVRCLKDSD